MPFPFLSLKTAPLSGPHLGFQPLVTIHELGEQALLQACVLTCPVVPGEGVGVFEVVANSCCQRGLRTLGSPGHSECSDVPHRPPSAG